MHRTIRDYLDHCEFASSLDQLCDAFSAVVLTMGLNAFAYLSLIDDPQTKKPLLISTYDHGWTSHYLNRRYDNIDPVIRRARESPEPFTWGPHLAESTAEGRTFFNEAAAFGIRHGMTVPVPFWRGASAALTAISTEASVIRHTSRMRLDTVFQFIAYDFHANVRNLIIPGRQIEGIHLSRREIECLEWAMRGKSAGDTAQLLGISRRTVVTHLERAKEKLGVRTVCQAVAIYAAHAETLRTGKIPVV